MDVCIKCGAFIQFKNRQVREIAESTGQDQPKTITLIVRCLKCGTINTKEVKR
jgi:hypothetical protein